MKKYRATKPVSLVGFILIAVMAISPTANAVVISCPENPHRAIMACLNEMLETQSSTVDCLDLLSYCGGYDLADIFVDR